MGYDVSYHPVDLTLIQERILPYIAGEGDIDDLVEDAVRLSQTRFRANQWGLGLMSGDEQPERFHPELHVWGRPFFIEADSPQGVSDAIDRYQAVRGGTDAVDEVVRDMLEALQTGLADRAKPSQDGSLPEPTKLARGIRWKVDLMKAAVAARRQGQEQVQSPDGRVMDVGRLLSRSIPHIVLEFSSEIRPGWMARGRVWPTLVCQNGGVDVHGLLSAPGSLVRKLSHEIPECLGTLVESIQENYQVGGMAEPDQVSALRQRLSEGAESILSSPQAEGEQEEFELVLLKLDEALADAKRRKMGFCEATEIYSAPAGIMN